MVKLDSPESVSAQNGTKFFAVRAGGNNILRRRGGEKTVHKIKLRVWGNIRKKGAVCAAGNGIPAHVRNRDWLASRITPRRVKLEAMAFNNAQGVGSVIFLACFKDNLVAQADTEHGSGTCHQSLYHGIQTGLSQVAHG